LSYSHRDRAWCQWLHGALEGYRIDKDLIGRTTPAGPVPKTLRPIFRDREDFSAGHSLTAQTEAALEGSQFLVAICSPNAAQSAYVNEEIRRFKALGRDDRIIPLIVDGEPGDPARECFPAALRFKLAPDGALSDEREEPIAADARPQGDGKNLARQKLVAGLLGLGLDEIVRRAERARRRRNRIFGALAGVFLLLAVAATGSAAYAWQQLKTNEAFLNATLTTATEIVNTAVAQAEKYNVPRTATLDLLARAEVLFDNMAQYGRPTPELRYRKAAMLIEFARNYEVLGDTGKQLARAGEAHRLLAGLAAEKPDDLAYQRELSVAHHAVGDVLRARGQLDEALTSYRASLVIRERLAAADRGNAQWQRDLSGVHNRIGDALESQGKLDAALASYRKSVAICEAMAAADPNDAMWQRSLSVALGRVGDVLHLQGKLDEALASYRAVHDRLAAAEAGNVAWQRERSVALGKIGDVLRNQDKLDEALASYRAAQAIDLRLTALDPSNVHWQHDLSSSHERVGNVLREQFDFAGALREYEAKRAILERLAASDPGNAGWQRDLSVSYNKIGDMLRFQGKLDDALATFRKTLAIDERLSAADPSNAEWQRDISVAHERIGAVLQAQRKFDDALASYRASVVIRERIARANPSNSRWQRDYAVGHAFVALTYRDMRKLEEALSEFRQGRQIMAALVERAPGFPQWEKELASFERDVAALEQQLQSAQK
jgi:tetratricopeptide (TPR) repeat protein